MRKGRRTNALKLLWDNRPQITKMWDRYNEDPAGYANQFLFDALFTGPLPSIELLAKAARVGLDLNQLRGAKKRLGAVSARRGAIWVWSLPDPEAAMAIIRDKSEAGLTL